MEKIGVCIVTYNEENYVGQCIESVLMQHCDAHVVAYIGEDASTDDTLAVCRQYVERFPENVVLLAGEPNMGLVRNTQRVLEQIVSDGCDYVAMLDGDDYWIDSDKLQKQIDFLRKNPAYGFIHTAQQLLINDRTFKKQIISPQPKSGDVWSEAGSLPIANCTVLFRTALLKYCDFASYEKFGFMSVDYTMYIVFARHTSFQYLPDVTAVWRRGHSSVSGGGDMQKQLRYSENGISQWKYLSTIFPERWPYSEENGNKFRRNQAFLIGYKYGDFHTVSEALHGGIFFNGWKYKVMEVCARNPFLFNLLYCLMFKNKERY